MSKQSSSDSIGVGGLLLVAFIVLKLCKVIAWSWWWVLSPIWFPIVLALVFLVMSTLTQSDETERPIKKSWDERIKEMQARNK